MTSGSIHNMIIGMFTAIVVAILPPGTIFAQEQSTDSLQPATTGAISGKVVNHEGNPLEGINIYIMPIDNESIGRFAWTDLNGQYTVEELSEGNYHVLFSTYGEYLSEYYENQRSLDDAYPVQVSPGVTTANVNATLERPGIIRGRVLDQNGMGLPNINVQANSDLGGFGGWQTDNGGAYTLTLNIPGSYQVYFYGDGYLPDYYDQPTDGVTKPVTVTLDSVIQLKDMKLIPEGRISGQVTQEGGAPLSGVFVVAVNVAITNSQQYQFTGENGNFSFGQLPPGDYQIMFSSNRGEFATEYYDNKRAINSANLVHIEPGSHIDTVNAKLERMGTLVGEVHNLEDQPFSNATVSLVDPQDNGSVAFAYVYNGTFRFERIPAGEYKLLVESTDKSYLPEYYNNKNSLTDAETITVRENQTTSGIVIKLANPVIQNLALHGLTPMLKNSFGGSILAMVEVNSYLYASYGATIATIDISNFNNPQIVSQSEAVSDTIVSVKNKENFVIAAAGKAGLVIYDISQPNNAKRVAQAADYPANLLVVEGNYAYVAVSAQWPENTGRLLIYNINNPRTPGLITNHQLNFVPVTLSIKDGIAYIGSGSKQIEIIDFTNPQQPVSHSKIEQLEYVDQLAVVNSTLYVVSRYGKSYIYDVSDLKTPKAVGTLSMALYNAVFANNLLYTFSYYGWQVYRLTDPLNPKLVLNYNGLYKASQMVNLEIPSAFVFKTHLYITNSNNQFISFELTAEQQPIQVGIAQLPIQGRSGFAIENRRIWNVNAGKLQVFDLNKTALGEPISSGSIRTDFSPLVYLQGTHAYLAGWSSLSIVDRSNLSALKPQGVYTTSAFIFDTVIVEPRAYLLTYAPSIEIVDLSNPDKPILLASHSISATIGMDAVGNTLYLAKAHQGLQIIDATSPRNLKTLSTVIFPAAFSSATANDVHVAGNYAYVGTSNAFYILDVKNPVSPTIMGRLDIPITKILTIHNSLVAAYSAGDSNSPYPTILINVADPTVPFIVTRLALWQTPTVAQIEESMLYISGNFQSINSYLLVDTTQRMLDMHNPIDIPIADRILYRFEANSFAVGIENIMGTPIGFYHRAASLGSYAQIPEHVSVLGPFIPWVLDNLTGNKLETAHPFDINIKLNTEETAQIELSTLTPYIWENEAWQKLPLMSARSDDEGITIRLNKLTPWILAAIPKAANHQVYLPIVASSDKDLRIMQVEVNQVIQTPGNDIPLIAGKPTMIRVHASTTAGTPVNNVYLSVSATRNGVSLLGSPIRLGPWAVFPEPNRSEYRGSFNTLLPLDWLYGDVKLITQLESSGQHDADPSNNQHETNMHFTTTPAMDIKVVPIRFTDSTTGKVYEAVLTEDFSDDVLSIYPMEKLNISFHVPINYSGDLGTDEGWGNLLKLVHDTKLAENALSSQIYYGLVPTGDFRAKWGGMAYFSRSSIGFGGWGIVAHEIGHNFQRMHAPCGNPGGPDPGYPYAEGSIGQYGFSTNSLQIFTPIEHKDMMSYCGPIWVSDYTYRSLYEDQLIHGVLTQANQQVQGILVRANIMSEDDAEILPTYQFTGLPSQLPEKSEYNVALLNDYGNAIASYPVSLEQLSEGDITQRTIHAFLPTSNTQISSVQVRNGQTVLAQRRLDTESISAASQIQFEQIDKALILRGITSSQVPALVRYTNNGGVRWITLGVDIVDNTMIIPTDYLPGGIGQFEVIAADRQYTALVTSAQANSISFPDRPPRVWITGKAEITLDQPLVLYGHGDDAEDGVLDSFQWLVDDKKVESSATLQLNSLSIGEHKIRLTMEDSGGHSTTVHYPVRVIGK